MMDQTKQTLLELYSRYWDGYICEIRKKTFSAFPFLIWPRESFPSAPFKIMICGQETQGWGNEYDDTDPLTISPRDIANIYNGFVNSGGYASPYWNFCNRIQKAIPQAGFVHNNIVKIGKREGAGCDDTIFWLSQMHFPVVREEIGILKPDLILFLTGKRYDERIRTVLGDFSSKKLYGDMYIEKLSFKDVSMPPAIKTYHPGYIQRQGLYLKYSQSVINEIAKLLPNACKQERTSEIQDHRQLSLQ